MFLHGELRQALGFEPQDIHQALDAVILAKRKRERLAKLSFNTSLDIVVAENVLSSYVEELLN